MRWWRRKDDPHDKPDVKKAHADLARIRAQREEVDALVAALVREKHLNNFTANVVITFRGGRA